MVFLMFLDVFLIFLHFIPSDGFEKLMEKATRDVDPKPKKLDFQSFNISIVFYGFLIQTYNSLVVFGGYLSVKNSEEE